MALSNWDTWAINQDSKISNGVFKSELGFQIQIYKNWLYLQDTVSWQEHGGFVEPTIMELWDGELRYKNTQIIACRGPKNGIYCAVWSSKPINLLTGIGCYGYVYDKWVGVTNAEINWLKHWLFKIEETSSYIWGIKEHIKKIDFESGGRFNQGDAYFADKLGVETPSTLPGKSDEPVINKLIK